MLIRSTKTCNPTTEHNVLLFSIQLIFEANAATLLEIQVLWVWHYEYVIRCVACSFSGAASSTTLWNIRNYSWTLCHIPHLNHQHYTIINKTLLLTKKKFSLKSIYPYPPMSTFMPHCFPNRMLHKFSLCIKHTACLPFHLVDLDSGQNVETDHKTTVLEEKLTNEHSNEVVLNFLCKLWC